MKRRDKQLMKWIGAPVCAGLIGLQFLRRTIPNPPVTAEIQAPAEVRQILRNSCYNCHSNETKLAWYDKVMPIGWLVAKDVRNARRHVNFSEIGDLPADQQTVILYEAVNKIQLGAMPLPSYRAIHPQATITAAQLAVLRAFLIASNPSRSDASTLHDSLSSQSTARIRPEHEISVVRPAPNGIAFIPEYKNWRAISTTDRFDNDTIRVVLGNDVAIKAIGDHHIDPWPDGTIMAKVVWSQRLDESGIAHAGSLQHIALMIRDSKKYAATENWGFAWWNGDELEPKGKDASFSRECVACHTPLRKNDYVFTTPLARPR